MIKDLINTAETKRIDVARLRSDGGTQMRAALDDGTVFEYTQAMIASNGWGTFPPLVAYYDGTTYWLGDGFHRLAAYRDAFPASSDGIPCEVRSGTRRDAILHAAGANALHGLRRTNADKRRAVDTLLRDQEWVEWSDTEIARRCAVSQNFVSTIRRELTQIGFESPAIRKGADGRTINTAGIGKNGQSKSKAPPPVSPEQRQYEAAARSAFTVAGAIDRDVKSILAQPPVPRPGELPADLAGRGWELKRVGGVGKYYGNNPSGPRATGVFDKLEDAVAAAYDMQRDLLREAPAPAAEIGDAIAAIRAANNNLITAIRLLGEHSAASDLDMIVERLREIVEQVAA